MTSNNGQSSPVVLGFGGTTRAASTSERVLALALAAAEAEGAKTVLLGAADLGFPHYAPEHPERDPRAARFLAEVAGADGIIVSSPAYHGGISGLIKNALDYIEDLRTADRPYLDGRAVGCLVCGNGWQATTTTLTSLRSVVHALRGWPTPLGVVVNSAEGIFDDDGALLDARSALQVELLGRQVVEFARLQALARSANPVRPRGSGRRGARRRTSRSRT